MTGTLVILRHGESTWNELNLFTGWHDVPLTERGKREAAQAGTTMREEGLHFDVAHTSVLTRAVVTCYLTLEELGQVWLPLQRHWRLNERHYGGLQGLDKKQTADQYGLDQVKIWRRSYDIPPPNGKALKNTAERTLPFFERCILDDIKQGKNVLVVAHGNSNRSIVMMLDNLSKEEVLELNLDTGVPLVYDLTVEGGVVGKQIL